MNRKRLALGCAVLLLFTQTAAAIDCGDVPLPPAQYDHAPPAAMVVIKRDLPFGLVDKECRAHSLAIPASLMPGGNSIGALLARVTDGGFEAQGCSWSAFDGKLGFVILPAIGADGISADWHACALRHELGHLNGWPASHPDAHYE